MIKPNILIYNLPDLFHILDELKKEDLFNIYNISFINNLENLSKIKIENYLIITNKKSNELKKFNNLIISKWPFKIENLVDKINISLLKFKYLEQSDLEINNYKLNLNSRTLSKDKINLKLTQKETEIILFLFKNSKSVSIINLQKHVWGYNSKLETHTVETHIYRLRKKILNKFHNENFIISTDDGYKIKK